MNKPLVSVVMPVYNAALYLEPAIKSILDQSYFYIEFIIVNDGSTDESSQLIQSYAFKDLRIKFIDRKINKGIVYTLNEGLKYCRGMYIARMDADDIALPMRIEKQVLYLMEHPEIDVLGSAYSIIRDGKIIGDVKREFPSLYLGFKTICNTYFCHPTVMFRYELLNCFGKYINTEAEDFEFFSRVLLEKRGMNLSEVLLHYREHGLNRSSEYLEPIALSVESIFLRNYKHLKGWSFCSSAFFNFYNRHKKSLLYFPIIAFLSCIIINKLRKQYKIPITDNQVLLSFRLLMKDLFQIS